MSQDFQLDETIRKSTGWVIALSIALIVLGIAAIILPGIASAFFTATIGWITLISGGVMIVQAFQSKPLRGFWLSLLVGIFYAIAGIYVLFNANCCSCSSTNAEYIPQSLNTP